VSSTGSDSNPCTVAAPCAQAYSLVASNGIVAALDPGKYAQSTVTGNTTAGFQINGNAVINSYGNNYFANNGSNTGSLTPAGTQQRKAARPRAALQFQSFRLKQLVGGVDQAGLGMCRAIRVELPGPC
jgi:hypothetical protein